LSSILTCTVSRGRRPEFEPFMAKPLRTQQAGAFLSCGRSIAPSNASWREPDPDVRALKYRYPVEDRDSAPEECGYDEAGDLLEDNNSLDDDDDDNEFVDEEEEEEDEVVEEEEVLQEAEAEQKDDVFTIGRVEPWRTTPAERIVMKVVLNETTEM
jgi:hypothetical protein